MEHIKEKETDLNILEPFHGLATTVDSCAKFSLNFIVESLDKLKVEVGQNSSLLADTFNQMSSIPENNTVLESDAMSTDSHDWDSISMRFRDRNNSLTNSFHSTGKDSRSSAGKHSSGKRSNHNSRASSVAGRSSHSSSGSSCSSSPTSQVADFERLRSEMVNETTMQALKARCCEATKRGTQKLRKSDDADWRSQVAHVRRGCGGQTIQGVNVKTGQLLE
ncbi:hypothetical protein GUITHDRAFT_150281 [Guillardia theta CCMP2712]|uniref:Uncharacterized protein n=1 Tax=Guillardia theta (strain CCMP2712) TaxID=905079 RepID=L1JZY4_GUITC|nr:hypothetical protein GUITHDRAFT_150281 [Guillardia theta CCMP2712]EKX53760.1 hypothetical protein GUITHDRAFT_150281 [Guillardia theta CCMP2712]|eukprot:XP_005840740.1 hypothetical protein GUITHDRAFT_150281 [Guillardia theta CCMP2712]